MENCKEYHCSQHIYIERFNSWYQIPSPCQTGKYCRLYQECLLFWTPKDNKTLFIWLLLAHFYTTERAKITFTGKSTYWWPFVNSRVKQPQMHTTLYPIFCSRIFFAAEGSNMSIDFHQFHRSRNHCSFYYHLNKVNRFLSFLFASVFG